MNIFIVLATCPKLFLSLILFCYFIKDKIKRDTFKYFVVFLTSIFNNNIPFFSCSNITIIRDKYGYIMIWMVGGGSVMDGMGWSMG